MSEFNWLMLGVMIGTIITLINQVRLERKDRPYRWECPDENCVFIVSSNDPQVTLNLTESHLERFHPNEDA